MISEHPPDSTNNREVNLTLVPSPVELHEGTSNGHLMTGQEELSSPVETEQVVQPDIVNVVLGAVV